VDCEPLIPLLPAQAPEAIHDVAWVDDQVKVELAPLLTVLESALKRIVGADAATKTVANCAALPPAPLQVRA
jgi:hypothetical protein